MLSPTPQPVAEGQPATSVGSGRTRRILPKVVAAFLVMVGMVATVQLARAYQHITSGAHDLNAVIAYVKSPAALKNSVIREQATAELSRARGEFKQAANDLFLWSPIMTHMRWIPKIGKTIAAAPYAASSAYYGTSSAWHIVRGISPVFGLIGRRYHGPPLLNRLARALAPHRNEFESAKSDAYDGMLALSGIPGATGSWSLDQAVKRLRDDLPRLRAAGAWLSVLPAVLGWYGPRRYLFCWENSREIRAVGGFIGATDLITFHKGYMFKHFSGSTLRPAGKELYFQQVPSPESELTSESSWLFRDSNFSPDFPTSARFERWFYGMNKHVWPDGVIDFVDQGVPDLLKATGPVYIPQYHVSVDANNAEALAQKFAGPKSSGYRGPGSKGLLDTVRKQFLGFEFAAIVKRLQTLSIRRWPALASAMGDAIQKRDILMYATNRRVEAAARDSGADGSLHHVNGDFVYIVDDNRSYNKIAPYVDESASYKVDVTPSMWLDSTVSIHYHLRPSPRDVEGQGCYFGAKNPPNGQDPCSKHDFQDFVRVYVPNGAVQVTASHNLKLIGSSVADQAYNYTQLEGAFVLREGRSTVVTFHYEVPANAWSAGNYHQYRLTIPRQPGATLKLVHVSVGGVAGIGVSPATGPDGTYQFNAYADRSRSITLRLVGNGHPTPAPLPLPRWRDPFVYWPGFKAHGHPL